MEEISTHLQFSLVDGRIGSTMSMRPSSPHKPPAAADLRGSRIGIYGLSANPPTIAHRNIVSHLCSQRIFDEIWILPVYQHIFDSKKNLESYEHRMAMCEISLTDITGTGHYAKENDTLVRISNLEKVVYNASQMPVDSCVSVLDHRNSEKKRDESAQSVEHSTKSLSNKKLSRVGTIDILEYVNALYPNIEWNLILGTDTYRDLIGGKWKRADEILQIAKLHVFCRENPAEMKLLSPPSSAKVTMYHIPGLVNVSSTNVRSRSPPIIFGSFAAMFSETAYARDLVESSYVDLIQADGLHPGVLAYIKTYQLYFMSPKALITRRRWFFIMLLNILASVVCMNSGGSVQK